MSFNGYLEIKQADIMASNRGLGDMGRVQKFVDSECIRLMGPYTPFVTGVLEKSSTLSTVIGSGEVKQNTPYSRYLYYGEVYGPNIPIFENGKLAGFFSPKGQKKHPTGREMKYNTAMHPKAGKLWFKRMVADCKDDILQGARKVAGAK